MSLRLSVLVPLLIASTVLAADLSEKWSKRLESADATYQQAIQKADNVRFYAVQKAPQERVKILKTALTDATKAGDFDAATEIKARLAAAETAGVRPRPKNVVKFGGHEYALIENGQTWYSAKRLCEEMGGHLIVLNSAEEKTFLDGICLSRHIVWLGASDHEKEDVYVWLTGEPVDTSDAVLDREQNGIADVLCYDAGSHKVIDWFSGGRLVYVCEWDR